MRLLPDSSVVIPFLSRRNYAARIERALERRHVFLCSAVAVEVLAGARDQREQRAYEAFFEPFQQRGLILTPTDAEWHTCGRMLSRYRRRLGAIEPRDHQNDVLILLTALRSAREEATTLLTENDAHFLLWLGLVHDHAGLRIEPMRRG